MAQLQRSVGRIGRDRHQAMTPVERFVRQPLVLAAEQQGDGAHLRLREQLCRGLARTLPITFGAALPRREPDDVHAVGERVVQPLVPRDPRQDVLCLMRNAFDPIGVELAGTHETQVAKAEILERPDDVRDVDEILGLVEDDGDAHPTSSSIPNRSGSCRSPRSHTQPFPPLQTSCPARRSRPGSISLMIRTKPTWPPTCAWCPSGPAPATVPPEPCTRAPQ